MTPELRIERLAPAGVALALPLLQAQFTEHAIPLSPGEVEEALRGLVDGRDRGAVLMASAPAPCTSPRTGATLSGMKSVIFK